MIEKLSDFQGGEVLETDVCIVGSGAAGIALACELDRAGISAILLESGSRSVDPGISELNEGSILSKEPSPPLPLGFHFTRSIAA